MSLLTKCYSCTAEILFPKGESTATCIYCGRINARPKSQANELTLMKFANERRAFGEFDAAANAYQKVLQRSLDEHEARWGMLLCRYGVMYVEDARTGKRVPTCRRSLPTSLCDEPDFRLACSQAPAEVREAYRRDGEYIDAIQREIRRLNATTEKYDIFICYKETDEYRKRTSDSVLAQNLYQQLKLHGFNAFYAPVSLNKQLGANYEAAIYHAVETARVMLVLSTKPEYLETTWVRSEWKRYLDRIDAGEDKLLIPLYRDFTPDKLPEEFTSRYLQGLNMGDFGFMTYLESFLSEIFHGDEPKSAPETPKLDNLLDRGFMELEDGDFAAAIECFTEALNTDVKSPRANLGMAMAELQAEDGNALVKICLARDDWDSSKYIRRADRFADAETAALFKRIRQAREDEQARIEAEKAREAEERARREAEERARREAEERARREAEERARREAEERARREAEERARQEAEERARREAEERARQEAEERARQEAEEKILKDFEFVIENGGAVITGYNGDATELRIPDRLKGVPVVKIGDKAFKDCSDLKSVIIPDGVTSIGDSAFKKCSSLFKVTIPDSVTSIEGGAFWDCSGLKEIIIPDSVASIGIGAFCGCFVLKEIIIPDSVTSIGSGAFWGCSALTVVRLPAGLTSICDEAFKDCDNLTSINIPDRVTTIGDSAFWGCSSLTDVRLPAGLITIGSNAFWDCSSLADVRLPAGLTTIGSNAFWSCKGLTSVAIPESVKQIKENAFEWCANLKSILVGANTTVENQGPDSPKIMRRPAAGAQASARTEAKKPQGDARREYHQQLRAEVRAIAEKDAQTARAEAEAVFRGVADAPAKDFAYETASDGTITILEYRGSAKVVAIPAAINGKRVAAIGESAFAVKKRGLLAQFKTSPADRHDWNKNLQAVRIPGGVRIGKCAFYCCGALKHVLLQGPCEMDEDAFGLCNHLEQIDLPEGVCQLGKTAFGFAALRSIRVPDSVRVLNYGALHYMSIENIYLPDGLTTIGPGAFEGTHIRSIYVPDGVRSLGYNAFYACRKLTDVYLPDGLTSIENNAFWNCEDLSEIHIPESVTSIGVGAFRDCKKLKSIRVSRKANVEDQQNTGMKIEYYD